MFSYRAYGLTITSDRPLPQLLIGMGSPDVTICTDPGLEAPSDFPTDTTHLHVSPNITYMRWPDVGLFRVENGTSILVRPAADVSESVLCNYIVGSALNHALYQRELFLLHASVVAVDGTAVAFLGESGWGKSTLAAYMQSRGWSLIADDSLVVDLAPAGGPMVLPGFPQLKLWPDADVSLGGSPDEMPRIDSRFDKRVHRPDLEFCLDPVPLGRLYALSPVADTYTGIEALSPQEALVNILSHSYGRFESISAARSAVHFKQCARVSTIVAVKRLKRRLQLGELPELAELIEHDGN